MTLVTGTLRWWEDRQVEVRLRDGRRCRGWVRECRVAGAIEWPASSAAVDPTDENVIGRMIVTLLPESTLSAGDNPYPAEVTVSIAQGGEHGRPRGVRLLVGEEALFAGQSRSSIGIRTPGG